MLAWKMMNHNKHIGLLFLVALLLLAPFSKANGTISYAQNRSSIQGFLDQQPGVLKSYQDDGHLAAAIIEGQSFYYGINPYFHIILLETTNSLISDPNPTEQMLRQPYSPAGPDGFADQIAWASREIRAGFGPYDHPPVVHFTDGSTITLRLDQSPEGVAIQRFLAQGRTAAEWKALNTRFSQVFADYFANDLPEIPDPVSPSGGADIAPGEGFLHCPWPIGMRVVHLAYFDHAYPTVDTGGDGNNVVVTYTGPADVQYNTHDGHDYFFPDLPVGTPILASAAGKAYASTARGNGIYIIHPGGYETVYWHLNHFAPKFRHMVDTGQGIWVERGEVVGTSGTSGFSYGTPHLHFEVRYRGAQVDPYGWYSDGPDPCEDYAGCVNHGWLWSSELVGLYDFTPPDYAPIEGEPTSGITPDLTPPDGTLSINPPDGLMFLARFDGHMLQHVGNGFAKTEGTYTFTPGRYGMALHLPEESGITYPISDNLSLDTGTISLWANIPEEYPPSAIKRHYIFAASANPEEEPYPGTLALRRDLLGEDGTPRWDFWTTPLGGEELRDDLAVPDTLEPGWHHMAVSWDRAKGSKTLYLDGVQVASRSGIVFPETIGPVLQLGRFTYDGSQSGIDLDELAIYNRQLHEREIARIAEDMSPLESSTVVLHDPRLLLDTNARDAESLIVAVQVGRNGVFEDPQPYYDAFRWNLPEVEGEHTLVVRYFDRASNQRVVSQTVTLDLPPRGTATILDQSTIGSTVAISVTDLHQPVDMQMSQTGDFAEATWEPARDTIRWLWYPPHGNLPSLYVRFRDAGGNVSEPVQVVRRGETIFMPFVLR